MQPQKPPWNPSPPPSSSLLLWHWHAEGYHLGGHLFHPDFCIVFHASIALWRNIRLTTGWPPPRNGLVSTTTHCACAVGLALVKLQTFCSWSFTSHPTPAFGGWRSTSGRSLFGIWTRWRIHRLIGHAEERATNLHISNGTRRLLPRCNSNSCIEILTFFNMIFNLISNSF